MFVPCLLPAARADGVETFRLGHPLLDAYLDLVEARARPNTVLATAYDLKVFFTVVPKEPAEVTAADVLAFIGAWLKICNELATRGVEDVIFVCVDGLKGLPEAIESVWPQAIVQTCVVHLVRASTRYVSYGDRKTVCAGLKEIYHAPNEEAALAALERFEERWGERYPAIGALWRDAWDRFVPMLDYPPAIRRVLYTTNMVESLNFQLRKITRNRGHFPTDDALFKLLYLGVRNVLAKKAREGRPGPHSNGWKAALNQFAVFFPGRLDII